MMTTVFREVRASPREWWYHRDLRKWGNHEEARKREHQSARSTVRCLRLAIQNGGFVKMGRGGWSLHYGDDDRGKLKYSNCVLSGYGCDTSHTVRAAMLLGILAIDTRDIPDDQIHETVSLPMAKPGIEERERFGGSSEWLDSVPPPVAARKYAALGATVYNADPPAMMPPTRYRPGTAFLEREARNG
jgi:hypothetical protein